MDLCLWLLALVESTVCQKGLFYSLLSTKYKNVYSVQEVADADKLPSIRLH